MRMEYGIEQAAMTCSLCSCCCRRWYWPLPLFRHFGQPSDTRVPCHIYSIFIIQIQCYVSSWSQPRERERDDYQHAHQFIFCNIPLGFNSQFCHYSSVPPARLSPPAPSSPSSLTFLHAQTRYAHFGKDFYQMHLKYDDRCTSELHSFFGGNHKMDVFFVRKVALTICVGLCASKHECGCGYVWSVLEKKTFWFVFFSLLLLVFTSYYLNK